MMTTFGRTLLLFLALAIGGTLLILGAYTRDDATRASGTAIVGAVVGYACGDRNGEKRSAAALAERGLDADAINAITRLLQVKPEVPTKVETPSTPTT